MEKIWIPDPDMYNMNACIGKFLAGLSDMMIDGDIYGAESTESCERASDRVSIG